MRNVCIVGTGLIGGSIALALREAGFQGDIAGIEKDDDARSAARRSNAFSTVAEDRAREHGALTGADVVVLATPVLSILDWMEKLSPILTEMQLVTDVGSTKRSIAEAAGRLFNADGKARFLPGHPMAGKESGGIQLAEANLFRDATWLFTPVGGLSEVEVGWRGWVQRMGARTMDMDAVRHDEVCAWVSHLPQMVATGLAALLEERFAGDAEGRGAVEAIGGRALREMTRLGASPYSMWRDVALTNTEAIAGTLEALAQRLEHVRENLRTPELREEFRAANRFREKR